MKMYSNVLSSVKNLISTNFNNVDINPSNLDEGTLGPYFLVGINASKSSNALNSYKTSSLKCNVIYKALSIVDDKKELLDMMSSLENIFLEEDIDLGDNFFASIYRVECLLKDDTLSFNFTLNFREEFESLDEGEFINNININI